MHWFTLSLCISDSTSFVVRLAEQNVLEANAHLWLTTAMIQSQCCLRASSAVGQEQRLAVWIRLEKKNTQCGRTQGSTIWESS